MKPGGRLVYATCSLLARENEDRAAAFAARHPDWRPDGARRLSPLDGGDGFFVAALPRAAAPLIRNRRRIHVPLTIPVVEIGRRGL